MTGTIGNGDTFAGAGSSSAIDGYCGHDEAELRASATQLERAEDEVRDAQAAVGRAESAAWQGPAAEGFRRSTSSLAVRLAALAAALGTLAMVLATLQSEAAACTGGPAMDGPSAGAPAGARAWRGLVVEGRRAPIAPLASREPALLLPVPSGPVFARGLASPGAGEGCR